MSIDENNWLDHFPFLKEIEDQPWHDAIAHSQFLSLPKGTTVYHEGDVCQNYILVLDGSVRVQKLSESGKEIVLYRVESGQTCVLTTSCLISHERYHAEAITETEVKAIAIPHKAFQDALGSRRFREFVFASYGERIAGLVMLIDAIAFGRMDSRLAHTVVRLANGNGILQSTHQELARELGTAREVISRLLKEFERHGWVTLQRGKVVVIDADALLSVE